MIKGELSEICQGIHLVYQYFRVESSPAFDSKQTEERQAEYQDCLIRNLLHKHVKQVHLLIENDKDQQELETVYSRLNSRPDLCDKVIPIWLGRRMTYRDAFEYCNNQLVNEIAVVMNADIFMGPGINELLEQRDRVFGFLTPKTSGTKDTSPVVLSLTRHEPSLCRHYSMAMSGTREQNQTTSKPSLEWCGCPFLKDRRYYGCHDSFWFIPPLSTSVLDQCNHVQNRWGAEHKVLNSLMKEGYHVFNPSVSIVTFHHHATDIHPWRNEAGGKKALADPRDHKALPPMELSDIYELISKQDENRIS